MKKPENDQPTPSETVDDILDKLRSTRLDLQNSLDTLSYVYDITEAGSQYWKGVDSKPFQTTPFGISANGTLVAYEQMASGLHQSAEQIMVAMQQLSSIAATGYATATFTSHEMIWHNDNFNPGEFYEVVDQSNRDELYARKFESFDPELGKQYREIIEIRNRTTSYPEKSILPNIRQVYDHFMRKLAPDKEVRKQLWWKPDDPEKPKMVTRAQRLKYAAEKHVKDTDYRNALLKSTDHTLRIHTELSALFHKDKPLDSGKALMACQSMLNTLNSWIDAISPD